MFICCYALQLVLQKNILIIFVYLLAVTVLLAKKETDHAQIYVALARLHCVLFNPSIYNLDAKIPGVLTAMANESYKMSLLKPGTTKLK